jgi:hypothetical protein
MSVRYKRPDKKNALSIVNAAKKDMEFTLSLEITEEAGATIIRNIYESFRMLGDALLVAKGIKSTDHIMPIKELLKLQVSTSRPINLIEGLRQLRHNINYYGYSPKLADIEDVVSIAKSCFKPLLEVVTDNITE